jgi:hypothetical protein
MKLEGTWTASGKPEEADRSEELNDMAGQWGVGIIVSVSMPYTYSEGSVERRPTLEEIPSTEVPHSGDAV